jgi:hypothetical protein
LFGYVSGINRRIVALGFHPCRKTRGKNLNIAVTKLFRLPGGFVTQLSGGPAAVKYQHRGLVFGQLAR